MPRPKSLVPTEPIKVYFTQQNAAKLRLLTTSGLTNKTVHGELSQFVNRAVEFYIDSLKKESENVHSSNDQSAG